MLKKETGALETLSSFSTIYSVFLAASARLHYACCDRSWL